MAILSSSRNLLIFGGLGVFALGWGGGLLLGAFSTKEAPPPPAQPQLLDADTLSSAQEAEKAEEQKGKSSSLLEQVFGLDDLEEEKPTKPAQRPKTEASRAAPKPAEETSTGGSADFGNQGASDRPATTLEVELEESDPAEEAVAPEKWQTDDGLTPPEQHTPPAEKPEKDILGDNPYK